MDYYRADPFVDLRDLHGGLFEVRAFGEEGEAGGGGLCLCGEGGLVMGEEGCGSRVYIFCPVYERGVRRSWGSGDYCGRIHGSAVRRMSSDLDIKRPVTWSIKL